MPDREKNICKGVEVHGLFREWHIRSDRSVELLQHGYMHVANANAKDLDLKHRVSFVFNRALVALWTTGLAPGTLVRRTLQDSQAKQ